MKRFNMFSNSISIAGIASLAVSCCANEKKVSPPPNFIIIIADDANWNDFGAYGNKAIKTPNIDELANRGIRFENAFITTSSSSPSRASILTGMYPHSTGAPELHMPIPADKELFVGKLKDAGYYTASIGKWHIGPHRSEFETILEPREASGAGDWINTLHNRPKEKPFFIWFAAMDPHRPYNDGPMPYHHDPSKVIVPPYLPDNEQTRKDLAMYYDEITRLDDYVGKVVDELKKQRIDDNTFILFMSDNGRPFPRCKTRMFDDGLKTPFIISWPKKIKMGLVSKSLVSAIDIAPTICELAGVEQSQQFQGVSFVPILYNAVAETREFIIGEHNWHDYKAHERAVRTKDYLYIRNSYPELNANPPADAVRSITYQEMIRLYKSGQLDKQFMDCFVKPRAEEEFYKLKNDPYHFVNLVQSSQYTTELNKLREILNFWIAETKDSIPANPKPDQFDRLTGKTTK